MAEMTEHDMNNINKLDNLLDIDDDLLYNATQ